MTGVQASSALLQTPGSPSRLQLSELLRDPLVQTTFGASERVEANPDVGAEMLARELAQAHYFVLADRLPLAALVRLEQLLLVRIERHDRGFESTATVRKTAAFAVRKLCPKLCPDDLKKGPSRTNAGN